MFVILDPKLELVMIVRIPNDLNVQWLFCPPLRFHNLNITNSNIDISLLILITIIDLSLRMSSTEKRRKQKESCQPLFSQFFWAPAQYFVCMRPLCRQMWTETVSLYTFDTMIWTIAIINNTTQDGGVAPHHFLRSD